ncbi:MAG: universal stress protein [Candidatus Marinimicrobia bacterium]|nr:universal stress protein [Candidatus Neomarinimicrobiota bacterium]
MKEKKSFLITTDFSESARFAYKHAIDLCKTYDGYLTLLHVINPVVVPPAYLMVTSETLVSKEKEKNVQKLINEEITNFFPKELNVDPIIATGVPFVEIISYARKNVIDMIIIATHGFTGLNHILFGSTAERVVRKSPCPVLTVRNPNKPFVLP